MPIRDRIIWGRHNPFGDPRLARLDEFVRDLQRYQRLPPGVKGGQEFENLQGDLPPKGPGYYREFDVAVPGAEGRGALRLVLGRGGEVYVTGNHYDDFRQVIDMPQ